MAALYVGDLHPDVTESLLLEKFSSVGRVHSIRLCRAMRPGTSNKYAFINFQHETDAEHALDLLNFDILLGQPMRIMWSNRNPYLRDSNTGNIFIKGLEKSIDSRALYDTFSNFGRVLSCKVVCDENGSRGYGYVHFENAEDAETAIRMLNGTLFNDHKVFITQFKSHQERQAAHKMTAKGDSRQVCVSRTQQEKGGHLKIQNIFEQTQSPTVGEKPQTTVTHPVSAVVLPAVPAAVNPVPATVSPVPHAVSPVSGPLYPVPALYVGDLHPDVTESLLLEKFSSVGRVLSIRLCRARRPGTSNNYAFISFQHWTDAERALDLLNYEILLGQPMRIMWSNRNPSIRNSNTGNIFIKGLETSIDSLALFDIFSEFGHILSCKVVCDENGSRGYGYVHFENAEAAETAIKKLNGTLFNEHKVFITHFKSHMERQTDNNTPAKGDNSEQVYVSQAQKEEEGRMSRIQNRFEQAQNPTVIQESRTTVTDTVPAEALPMVPAAFSPEPAAVNPVQDALNSVPALYVGDLHPDVTESHLLETFGSVARVLSIRLCRARRPGTSNNYAFINFQHETDAEHALHLLNFNNLLGQPMRIMWSKRNTSLRSSNTGNIFIKGLEKSIDSLALYDTFSNFGHILSCKVVCDENGSRGYGYVHFENAEAAETAIKKLNGTLFNEHKVFITHFKSRQERQAANKTAANDDNKNQCLPLPKNKKKRKKRHAQKKP